MHLYSKLDCGFPDKPEVAEAGDIAELAYIRCMLRSRAGLTDGVIDRRVVGRWLVGLRGRPEAHMKRLFEVGLIEEDPAGWRIPPDVWRKWNPTASEVEAKRQDEADRKRHYRESKKSQQDHNGTDADVPPGQSSASAVRPVQPEPEPEPEKENTSSNGHGVNGSSAPPRVRVPKPDDDPDFAAWWSEYPRKVERRAAASAYAKARRTATPAAIAEGLARWNKTWRNEGRPIDKTPYPASWLNKGAWADELEPVNEGTGCVARRPDDDDLWSAS